MAKEFKRSSSKDFKGKKAFNPNKGKSKGSDKKSSFSRSGEESHPFAAFKREKSSVSEEKESYGETKDKYSKSDKKPSFGRSNERSDDKFKRSNDSDFKGEKSSTTKKARPEKRDKPAFERFKDDARPSDFGSAKSRSSSSFEDKRKKSSSDKPFFKKTRGDEDEKPSFRDRDSDKTTSFKKSFSKKTSSEKPLRKPTESDYENEYKEKSESRSFDKKPSSAKPKSKSFGEKSDKPRSFDKPRSSEKPRSFDKKPSIKSGFVRKSDLAESDELNASDFAYGTEKPSDSSERGRGFKKSKPYEKKTFSGKKTASKPQRETEDGLTRLNKYLSNAGICSRREADDLITSGVVQVNGKTITEMGYRVKPTDIVKYGGQTLKKERLVYLILNKPKDYITTADDPQERRTVLELIQGACKERIYPVGRLDRATTGLLMFTNDGDLTKKLTHPRYGVRKIYHVELDKPLKRVDLDQIQAGIELEDGPIKVDEVTYVGDGADKTQVGVEIHSGKNRIVRRIFEHMGYNVRKLDRVVFGSLTKKDLPRGRWRILSDAEVGMLKMISSGE